MFRRKNTYYTSKIDKMLEEFDKTHEKSPAQLKEIEKYDEVYKRRDANQETDSE